MTQNQNTQSSQNTMRRPQNLSTVPQADRSRPLSYFVDAVESRAHPGRYFIRVANTNLIGIEGLVEDEIIHADGSKEPLDRSLRNSFALADPANPNDAYLTDAATANVLVRGGTIQDDSGMTIRWPGLLNLMNRNLTEDQVDEAAKSSYFYTRSISDECWLFLGRQPHNNSTGTQSRSGPVVVSGFSAPKKG